MVVRGTTQKPKPMKSLCHIAVSSFLLSSARTTPLPDARLLQNRTAWAIEALDANSNRTEATSSLKVGSGESLIAEGARLC